MSVAFFLFSFFIALSPFLFPLFFFSFLFGYELLPSSILISPNDCSVSFAFHFDFLFLVHIKVMLLL